VPVDFKGYPIYFRGGGNLSIKDIVSIIIFYFIFDISFIILAKRDSKILLPLKKIPDKWKSNYFYKWLVLIPLLVMCSSLVVLFQLNYIVFGLLVGFTLSLCDTAFKKNIS